MKESLSLENTLWADTVLASQGFVIGIVLYTGRQTRSQMNSKTPTSKTCLLDQELNFLSKILFVLMLILSFSIVVLNGFQGEWVMFYFRVVLLLSSIIPISLRVNLDLAKMYYSYCINRDEGIPGTIARNSTIPEELGRIQFLITDKTGTLTQNDMICKRLMTEFAQFSSDDN
jgi:phospholipid-translocating ATPase